MNQEKIGAFIARRRKEKKLTQAKLASYLGITDRAYLNGKEAKDYLIQFICWNCVDCLIFQSMNF